MTCVPRATLTGSGSECPVSSTGMPRRMKKGGFSMTSWPMFTIRSAASIARCTKSPEESAAQPMKSGWRSTITPLPSWVVTKGMPNLSTSRVSIRLVSLRLPPAPMTINGERAYAIRSTAAATALSSGTGRRVWERVSGRSSVCLAAMSSGSSRCAAPGFSSSASRNASRTRLGMLSAEMVIPNGPSPASTLADQDVVSVSHLSGVPLILLARMRAPGRDVDELFWTHGLRPDVRIEAHSVMTACALAGRASAPRS
nr:hypothetical protein [Paracoccus sp. S-4012]